MYMTTWWKNLKLQVKTSYVRDRVPEFYVWALTLFLEPYYSQARILVAKVFLPLVVLDDTYDAYATIEELRVLTHAINRWDITAMSQLPEYIKPFYKFILDEYAEWNKQVPQQGTTNLIEASKKVVPSFKEYMKIGSITCGYDVVCKSELSSMGHIVTQEVIAWYENHPKILTTSPFIIRLHDDVMTFAFEHERAELVTSVDAYMKTFGVSENVAVEAIKNIVENGWKDLNEGCLKPREVPMEILAGFVNLTRTVDVFYKYNDGLTFPENMFKEYITLLFCVSVPM
ncbi:putative lyase [Helianthus anomalus]